MASSRPLSFTGLSSVPVEILLLISRTLSLRDTLHLATTCRGFSKVLIPEMYNFDSSNGYRSLLWACYVGRVETLKAVVRRDSQVVNRHFDQHHSAAGGKPQIGRGMTPLSIAVARGKLGFAKVLIKLGADANQPDRAPALSHYLRWYPIHWALSPTKKCDQAGLIKLLAAGKANLNQIPKRVGPPPLRVSGEFLEGDPPIFQCLDFQFQLPYQFPYEIRHTQPAAEEYNQKFQKVLEKRLERLRTLILHGASPTITNPRTSETPLQCLVRRLFWWRPKFTFSRSYTMKHEESAQARIVTDSYVLKVLQIFKDVGIDLNASHNRFPGLDTPGPTTLLHVACNLHIRHGAVIDWLLEQGADINAVSSLGCTPIFDLLGNCSVDLEFFTSLVKTRPKPDLHRQNHRGETLLHVLAKCDHLGPYQCEKIAKLLLDHGVDPCATDIDGKTADQYFLGQLRTDVREMLVQAKDRVKKQKQRAERKTERAATLPSHNSRKV